jgi:hypothetical protein
MAFGMKETDHSLSLYFGFIGAVAIVALLLQMEGAYVRNPNPLAIFTNPVVLAYIIFNLFVGATYLFLAIRLKTLLVTNPKIVKGVIIASMVLAALSFLAGLLGARAAVGAGSFLVEMLIGVYLLVNVNRLAQEQNVERKWG